jgi:hypothetical protein
MKPEAQLQSACFRWFRMQYIHLAWLYFAVPNGGSRNVIEASNLKRQGVLSGIADTFLAVSTKLHHGLFVEFKHGKGRLTENQGIFKDEVENQGYGFAVVRSVDEFMEVIKKYFKE